MNRQFNRNSRRPEALERRLLLAASVVINEIHYDPDVKTEQVEFIELHNPGDEPFPLAGASFTNGVTYTFPTGASLPGGGFLVVTENAAEFQTKFGVVPFGQFVGSLDNDGEKITLKNAAGATLDEVDYGAGFPWPTVGVAPGHSIELIHPSLDNDLGGSWRSAATPSGGGGGGTVLFQPGSPWRYRKGTSEASTPIGAWRGRTFAEDGTWFTGTTPIGYDSNLPMGTPLNDMDGVYSSVFLRKTFTIADPSQVGSLLLDASYDDGFNVWVNGNFGKSVDVSQENLPFSGTSGQASREDAGFYSHVLSAAGLGLVAGTNVIAVQFFNVSRSGSSDAFFNARLTAQAGGAGGGSNPSPGRINGAFATNAAPQMRQVEHTPKQPSAGQPVTITTKVTDPNGVSSVSLKYQLVNPGDYIAKEDVRYENPANWTSVSMFDNGTNGDAAAGDSVYTAVLPGSLQTHRRLVRYRITSTDALGASITGPYTDDEQPNFAYFVYNQVPAWTGSDQPGAGQVTYGSDVLNSLPTYQLVTTRRAHEESQHIPNSTSGGYGGDNYPWSGALVYDGEVYDHIHFRARGGVWRYAMGKNMWKFDFNRNHDFEARDAFGNRYPVEWTKLNLGANIQQGDFGHRGEQGLFEYVGFKLFNLAGVPASNTAPVHFRIVESASETGDPSNQYDDDFQGLYLAVEQDDGRFLDSHKLPDGNFYKMEGGFGTKNNQGPTAAADSSDLSAFMSAYSGNQTDDWWRQNFNLPSYYNYRAIVEGIHHYDIAGGKNYFYYNNPETGKWETVPWDLDLTWADNMFGDGNEPFLGRVLNRAAFLKDYRNRLRELRDLLFNVEQTGRLIDEYANLVDRPADANSFVDADRAMWDYNPILESSYVSGGKAGHGRFYQAGGGTFRGMAQLMKNYVASRGSRIDNQLIGGTDENASPRKGAVSYTGPANFPADQLRFSTSGFAPGTPAPGEPVGQFAAMKWRIADVTPTAAGQEGNYEIKAAWESPEITAFNAAVMVPSTAVVPGHVYRVRVRFKDTNGRWGHWSDAVNGITQFTVGGGSTAVRDALRVTEVNYNPVGAGLGTGFNNDDFEFVELKNIGQGAINLENVHFMDGLEFTFPDMLLPPGEKVVVVNNLTAFRHRYGSSPQIRVAGSYAPSGSNLNNAGEQLILLDASNQEILRFTYDDDGAGWHATTDGGGYSLTVNDPLTPPAQLSSGGSWHASRTSGGTPGYDESATAGPAVVAASFDFTTPVPRVRVKFDRDVQGVLNAADLSFRTLPGGSTVPASAVAWDAGSMTATFTLAQAQVPNGDYLATVSGPGLTMGGAGLPSDFLLPFYVLTGDVNRDRRVDGSDFALLAGNFGKTGMSYDRGDLNGDGAVNGSDFSLLAGNFGRTLPSPPPLALTLEAVTLAAAPEAAQPAPVAAAPAPAPTPAPAPQPTKSTPPPANTRRRVTQPTPAKIAPNRRRRIVEPRIQ